MELHEFLSHFKGVKKCGNGYMAQCPAPGHDDKNPSLSIDVSEDGTKILINCFANCPFEEILSAVGLEKSDLFINQKSDKQNKQVVEKTLYHYYDVDKTLLYMKERIDYVDGKKSIYFMQPDGTKGVKGVKRVPYNLPEVLKASTVYFVEGEKCADSVIKQGYCATTLDSGANSKWLPEYKNYFKNKNILIIPDNDKPGMKYAKEIAKHLPAARIIPLRKNGDNGYDIADWLSDGYTIEMLDNLPSLDSSNIPEKKDKRSQANVLLEIIEEQGMNLYLNQVNDVYISIFVDDHMETWPLESKSFSEWLQGIFYQKTKHPIRTESVKQVITILTAKAKYEKGEKITLFNRVAEYDNALWYDLCNKSCQAIQVTAQQWKVIDTPPVLFERHRHQKEQVIPRTGGDIKKIFQYVNLKEYHILFLCWLVSCFIPDFPHAMSIIHGEKGAAKSTACVLLKRLIDPSALDHLTLQNDQRTLVVNLSTHWYLPFDNVSSISIDTSDMLCRAITGGGIQQRKLCTNAEDHIFTFCRCITINGINNVANRADLLDRSLMFELTRVSESKRKELKEIYQSFENDRASILGGIFDTLSKAIALHDSVKLDKLFRMADFTKWGYAIGQALGGYGEQFLEEYEKNQSIRDVEAVNSDIVATLVVAFMEDREIWKGYVAELLVNLHDITPRYGINPNSKGMPTQPNSLSRRLNSIQSNLGALGVTFTKEQNSKGTQITLRNASLSPLPPYRADTAKILDKVNGDSNGDTTIHGESSPLKVSQNINENGDNGDDGDEDIEF